jgi:hypothetical protein
MLVPGRALEATVCSGPVAYPPPPGCDARDFLSSRTRSRRQPRRPASRRSGDAMFAPSFYTRANRLRR